MYTSKSFNYKQDFRSINFRKHPEKYQVGRGEQGVLMVEPYKSEILPYWRFKTAAEATKSSRKIYQLFLAYKKQNDLVGMDMARKFLQMGYTRARRYANHPSGRKYMKGTKTPLPQAKDWGTNEKAQAARIFYGAYLKAREDKTYQKLKAAYDMQKPL